MNRVPRRHFLIGAGALLAAPFAAELLRGARPRDVSVEQPTKFRLVINLKTAKALGVTIPQPIPARAEEVIQ